MLPITHAHKKTERKGAHELISNHYIFWLLQGVNAARAGTLTFMMGGAKEDIDQAEEVLLQMGKTAIHCGPVGCGGAAKICNNMMLAISMVGHSETMNLGIKYVSFGSVRTRYDSRLV